jgi:hypothetical protein
MRDRCLAGVGVRERNQAGRGMRAGKRCLRVTAGVSDQALTGKGENSRRPDE